MASRQRRLLIVSGNLALLRGHYQDVITALARAGVDVRIRYIKEHLHDPAKFEAAFRDAGVEVDVSQLPRERPRPVRRPGELLALRLRQLGNILRFSHPDYTGRTVLSERALQKTGASARRWGRRIRRLGSRRATRIARLLARIESLLPPSRAAVELLANEQPDAVAVVPVIRVPALVEFLKAASAQNVPTVIWVQSWDNLTNKGLLHFTPDRVFVWNEIQEQELSRYHGVPADHVCMTGAQTFDHWFNTDAVVEREEFCERLGIDPKRPIVLYLASSKQIAPDEPEFFARWLDAIRSSEDALLRSATVLVRPHPTLAHAWQQRRFDREPGVVVSPSTLQDEINSSGFRAQYRGELHHSTVAVGINTSAFIDAAIFGKPTCTVELPELFHGQKGTVHYDYLTRPGAELLQTTSSLEEHAAALSELIRRDAYARDERSAEFVRAFVRPHGLDVRPADLFVKEMLKVCEEPSRISPPAGARRAFGRVLAGLALFVVVPLEARPFARLVAFLESPSRHGVRPKKRKTRWSRIRNRARVFAYLTAHRVLPERVRRALRAVVPAQPGKRGRVDALDSPVPTTRQIAADPPSEQQRHPA
jgi:hypothetical protein